MAWQRKREFHDMGTGMHVAHLHEPESGATGIVQIHLGHDHVIIRKPRVKDNLEDIDPKALIDGVIADLDLNHEAQRKYAVKHRIPVRKAAAK